MTSCGPVLVRGTPEGGAVAGIAWAAGFTASPSDTRSRPRSRRKNRRPHAKRTKAAPARSGVLRWHPRSSSRARSPCQLAACDDRTIRDAIVVLDFTAEREIHLLRSESRPCRRFRCPSGGRRNRHDHGPIWQTARRPPPIVVSGMENTAYVSFKNETLAALSKAGCNMGACHGSPSARPAFACRSAAMIRRLTS